MLAFCWKGAFLEYLPPPTLTKNLCTRLSPLFTSALSTKIIGAIANVLSRV